MPSAPANIETLQALSHHIDFEFDPAVCEVSEPAPYPRRYTYTRISEVGYNRFAEFMLDPYDRPPYARDAVDGALPELPDDDPEFEPKPDDARDKTLHGLLNERRGRIALYKDWGPGALYEFQIVNGPGGVNIGHETLGKTPGVDVPTFVPGASKSRAGEITEAIADMKIRTPGVNDFFMVTHDLGSITGYHGPSWPHTHPAAYRQLSRAAQDVIDTYGDQIHDVTDKTDNRPGEVITIAKTMDGLMGRLESHIDSLSIAELRIRDGRYEDVSDQEIAIGLLRRAFTISRRQQPWTASEFLAVDPSEPEHRRYQTGYWIGMQLAAGVFETRLALHQARPHPEATDAQTSRTLGVLSSVTNEINRRLADNSEYTLAV